MGTKSKPSKALGCAAVLALSFALGCGDTTDVVAVNQTGTTIRTSNGVVRGESVGGARRFLGIPYAAPPTGDLRWRPPEPPKSWDGVRAAMEFSSACPQLPSLNGEPSENEDCLYLNVWAPEAAPVELRPVMVWIHGGGNEAGSASEPVPLGVGGTFYDGIVFAEEHDVVLVTANYRLGVLGFFAHPALSSEDSARASTGNQGLLDQRQMLRWVRENIAAFGGDPENVTVFGQSAGATDICLHLVSPGSRGLFHRAIAQSGGCTTRQRTAAEFAGDVERLASEVGCTVGDLACLRGVSVPTLLAGAAAVGPQGLGPPVFTPVVDGTFLPDQPRALFDAGAYERVPYLAGSTSDEGSLFFVGAPALSEEEYAEEMVALFGETGTAALDAYPAARFDSPRAALTRAFGDFLLVCPTLDSARRVAAGGAPVFLYNYSFPIQTVALQPLMLGATHGSEISPLFRSIVPPNPETERVGDLLRGYWTRHARTGDPNGASSPAWPLFSEEAGPRLDLGVEPAVWPDFRGQECAFWESVYDAEFGEGR